MTPFLYPSYEKWAPVIARWFIAFQFLFAAYGQIPGTQTFYLQAAMTGAHGVPFPTIAVTLAFLLEVVTGIMLIVGWQTRAAAFVLAPYTLLLAVIFYHDWSNPLSLGLFISHLGLIAALLYISVYGARAIAVQKD